MKVRNRFAVHVRKKNSAGPMKGKRKNTKLERQSWKKILKNYS